MTCMMGPFAPFCPWHDVSRSHGKMLHALSELRRTQEEDEWKHECAHKARDTMIQKVCSCSPLTITALSFNNYFSR